MEPRSPLCLLTCGEAREFAEIVAGELGESLTPSRDVWFACGEGKHVIDVNIRGTDVYIVQQAVVPGSEHSVYDRWMMVLHAALTPTRRTAAARRSSCVATMPPNKNKTHSTKKSKGDR